MVIAKLGKGVRQPFITIVGFRWNNGLTVGYEGFPEFLHSILAGVAADPDELQAFAWNLRLNVLPGTKELAELCLECGCVFVELAWQDRARP